jgi:hypothetical protein
MLQLAGLLAAVLFRVLVWQYAVWVRVRVVHLLVLLAVEGPSLLYAPLLLVTCSVHNSTALCA